MNLEREEHMKYKITAGQTIYATYEIELSSFLIAAAGITSTKKPGARSE